MALPTNILQNVQRYMDAQLAWLINYSVVLNPKTNIANTRFKEFNKIPGNLGDTVTFDLAPRAQTQESLVISDQGSEQRVQSLSVTQALSSNYTFNAEQYIFNVMDYMDKFGKSRMYEIGAKMEKDLLRQVTSSFVVRNSQSAQNGQIVDVASGPYRFFANGWTIGDESIPVYNSVTQLDRCRVQFRNYGAAQDNCVSILPDIIQSDIVGNALNQFVEKRNEEYAMGWKIGNQGGCNYYQTNLLPNHQAGAVGDATNPGNVLTVVSTNETNGVITEITFNSPLTSQTDALVNGDLIQFDATNNFRYLTFIGHFLSDFPVQVRCTADVDTDGSGNVTVPIYPSLVNTSADPNQNINQSLTAGRTAGVVPSHKAGVIMSGKPFYYAAPELPDEIPFPTVHRSHEGTALSLRNYWGTVFKQNQRSYVYDVIYGSTLVAENTMRICIPDGNE